MKSTTPKSYHPDYEYFYQHPHTPDDKSSDRFVGLCPGEKHGHAV